jgi:hypothetical protein
MSLLILYMYYLSNVFVSVMSTVFAYTPVCMSRVQYVIRISTIVTIITNFLYMFFISRVKISTGFLYNLCIWNGKFRFFSYLSICKWDFIILGIAFRKSGLVWSQPEIPASKRNW